MKCQKKSISINIYDLISLFSMAIGGKFEKVVKELKDYDNRYSLSDDYKVIRCLSQGFSNNCFIKRKMETLRTFISEYKIPSYSGYFNEIGNFDCGTFFRNFICNLDSYEKLGNYFIKHIKEKDKILSVLLRIKSLGIKQVEFNKGFDFTKDKYDLGAGFNFFGSIYYLSNIEVIPHYSPYTIYYKTSDSPFKINISLDNIGNTTVKAEKILVNSFLFDPELLPKEITKECTYDFIIRLSDKCKNKFDAVRDYVYGSEEVEKILANIEKLIKRLERLRKIPEFEAKHDDAIQQILGYITMLSGELPDILAQNAVKIAGVSDEDLDVQRRARAIRSESPNISHS